MKTRCILLAAALLTGCASWTFERTANGITTSVTRTGFATDISADDVHISWGKDGSATIRIKGGSSDQTRALEAVAKGAAAGAKGGL